MKILSLLIFKAEDEGGKTECYLLSRHMNVSSFSFFIRAPLIEHILFHSRLLCSMTSIGQRQSVEFDNNLGVCHVFRHNSGISGAVITDPEYPPRVAFVLLNRALSEFLATYPPEKWPNCDSEANFPFPTGDKLLDKFQNPKDVDELTKIEDDLKEIQGIITNTMDKILQRGENLEVLMSRTTDLSAASEKFYRHAKAQNQCCKWY